MAREGLWQKFPILRQSREGSKPRLSSSLLTYQFLQDHSWKQRTGVTSQELMSIPSSLPWLCRSLLYCPLESPSQAAHSRLLPRLKALGNFLICNAAVHGASSALCSLPTLCTLGVALFCCGFHNPPLLSALLFWVEQSLWTSLFCVEQGL